MALRDVNAVVTITTNAVKAIDDGKKLKQIYADINEQLNLMKSEGKVDTKEFKDMQKLAEDTKAKINEMLRGMELIDKVMGDISGHIGKDLNRALRETSKEFNKTSSSTDEGKAKLEKLRDVVADLKREISDRRGLTMSLKDAEAQLKNLDNASLDKLRQGLAAVREEAAKTADPTRRAQYQQYARNYEAQIAIKEHGNIGSAPATGTLKSEDRLRAEAERQRLVTAYQAASRSDDAAHKTWAAQALKEIQQYNSALDALTEKERKEAKAKAEQTAEAQKQKAARDTMVKLYNGEKASLQELTQAQKQFQAEIDRMKGFNMTQADEQQLQNLERHLERINQMLKDVSQADIDKVFADINSQSLETLEATLKKVKENAASLKVGDTAGIDKAAQQMDVLEKKIAEVKARMTEYTSLAERGRDAHKTLANIETASYEDLENTLKFLEERHKKLQGTETKRQQQSIANQDKIKKRMKEMRGELLSEEEVRKRVAKTGAYSTRELQQAYDTLKQKLMNLRTEEKEAIRETQRQMKTLQKEIESTSGKVTGLAKVWQTAVKNIGAYMGVFAIAGFAKNKLTELVKKNYELSDAIMNVRKVSGLAVEDINQLYQNIAKIDTRNTVNTLMDLAYQGGKLGIGNYGVEGLTGFVKAAEQVQMALGEEMGEEALPAMAKLTENMDLIRKYGVEEAMQKTASAIFQLYTTSVSTGTGIVDFAKRLMPIAKSAGVATDELLGLASATESSGLAAEVAATAFVKMFPSIYKNAEALEEYLNIEKGTIRGMYDQNQAMQAMVLVFDKMQGLGNLNKYPELFKLLGSEGARMNTVMTAMANNVDMLRTHLKTSTNAFIEGTAVINEYNLQNASAAAILERANNIWEKAFVNPEGVDMVKEMAQQWYNLSQELTGSETWMTSVKLSLSAIANTLGLIMKIMPTLIRALMFYGVAEGVRKLWIEFSALNGAMAAASTNAARLSAIMKSNVWVLGATAIAFAVTYLIDMAAAADKAADNLGALEEAEKNAKEESIRERVELKKLYDATQDQTKSIEERKDALRKMVGDEKYKQYYEKLANEKTLANLAANAYRDLTDEIIKSARARAYANKITELENKRMALEDEKEEKQQWKKDNKKAYEAGKQEYKNQQQYVKGVTGGATSGFQESQIAQRGAAAMKPAIINQYEGVDKAIGNLDNSISGLDKDMEKLKGKIEGLNVKPTPVVEEPGGGGGDGGGGGSTAKAPEWMVEEKKEAEKNTKAVIASIEEFYRLQEASANELAASGQLKGADFEMLVAHIQDRKDKMLLEARRAIVGDPNEFEKMRTELAQDIVKRDDAVSQAAMQRIQQAEPAKQGAVLRKYDGSDAVFGLDSNAWLNDVRKNAAQNELNIQRREAQLMQEIDKFLMQYQFIEQAQQDFGDRLVKLGLVSDGYAKVVKQLADGTQITANTAEVQQFANKVSGMGGKLYGVDTNNAQELARMTQYMMTDAEGNEEGFASIFPDYKKWLEQPELYKDKMVTLYEMMIQYEGIYYDAIKKRDDLQSKRLDSWWEHSDEKKQNDKTMRSIDKYGFQYNNFGENQGMGYMMGLTNDVNQDPEVLREKAILEAKMAIWEKAKEEREAGLISEEVYQQKLQQMQDATMNYTQAVMTNINKRIDRVKQFVKPVETAAKSIGQKLGAMISGMEEEEVTWEQIWKNMALAVAESMLTMAGQYAQNAIVKASMNKSEEAEEGAHATVMTMLGISEGAAKTIGTLGWLGIALIPVITALLMGLLQSALSTSRDSSSANAAKPKIKLASGMLTYDEGNVQTVVGDDGRVYRAREQRSLPEGVSMVTEPIATRVNGQQALVGERGPEIVIGRRTTRAIQMNRPDLLRDLALIDRGITTRKVRTFDEGNISDMASAFAGQLPATQQGQQGSEDSGQLSAEDARALTAAIGVFAQTVAAMQKNGIPAKIQKYGTGGLIDEVQSGLKFVSKYK